MAQRSGNNVFIPKSHEHFANFLKNQGKLLAAMDRRGGFNLITKTIYDEDEALDEKSQDRITLIII